MVTISVVIPTFNRAHTIGRAIQSVLCQTYRDLELIIVDDASTDDTKEVVKRFTDPRVMYVKHVSNKGGSAARNTGIKLAKGKYIAFLDSDDEWIPTKLEKQVKILDKSTAGAVYTGIKSFNDNGKFIGAFLPKHEGYIFDELLEGNCVKTASTVMVKRGIFDAGGFDEKLPSCQDWDMWLRIAKNYEFGYVPELLVNVYRTKMGIDRSIGQNVEAQIRGQSIIFDKYGEYFSTKHFRARHWLRIGKWLCLKGDMTSGRRYILYGVSNDVQNLKYMLYLMLSLFGHSFFSKLHGLVRERGTTRRLRVDGE